MTNTRTPTVPVLARLLAQAYVDGEMPNLPVTLPFGSQIPGAEHADGKTTIPARLLVDHLNEGATG